MKLTNISNIFFSLSSDAEPEPPRVGADLFVGRSREPEPRFCLKFADDTKLGQEIKSREDCERIQSALDTLERWAARWGMKYNTEKCHDLHMGRTNSAWNYTLNGQVLAKVDSERDIGVQVSGNLKMSEQCNKAARTATGVLGQVLRAFSYRNRTVLPRLFVQYVRPHLDFAVQAWRPWQRCDVDCLEKVQKKMVSAVSGLQARTYEDKLMELNMESIESRGETRWTWYRHSRY